MLKKTLVCLAGLILIFVIAGIFLVRSTRLPGEELTPAGMRRDTAVYVTMRDGSEIALDTWLPPNYSSGQRIPALMRTTRYFRQPEFGWASRLMFALHQLNIRSVLPTFPLTNYLNQHGYAVVYVDARGTGASGGDRLMEHSPDEVADIGEITTWVTKQPWSNGLVGAFGVSYTGNSAELSAVPNVPAMRAVAPLYNDFDGFLGLLAPGGVFTQGFAQAWNHEVTAMDRDDICGSEGLSGLKCWWTRQLTPGVKHVDNDPSGHHLAEILSKRTNRNSNGPISRVGFRDDPIQTAKGPMPFSSIAPYGQRERIESSGVSMLVWCGWMDAATCEGSLNRYLTFSNPQQLFIGPCTHGCQFNADPFLPAGKHTPPNPTTDEQYRGIVEFFDRLLQTEHPKKIESGITYYTMGEGKWHTTKTWPPEEFQGESRRYYFSDHGRLDATAPASEQSSDSYKVDFSTTSGRHTRWHTQSDQGDVFYPDRAQEDTKLLTYTSDPLPTNVEITGSPVITLEVSSDISDTAFFVYLEDVAPEGRVTYLDEGIFRAVNRKLADPNSLPYKILGPPHSFLRADAEPLVPGVPAGIKFALFPTSVLLHQGHRIRIALAGADTPLFQRVPAEGIPTWTIFREKSRASYVELPARDR